MISFQKKLVLAYLPAFLSALSSCTPAVADKDSAVDVSGPTVELGQPSEQLYTTLGPITVGGYTPLEEGVEGGRLIFTTPAAYENDPDINLTGPDNFRRDFEVEFVTMINGNNGLEPGVYTVAATDADMQLSEAKVMVREGQALTIEVDLSSAEDVNYNLEELENYEAYGSFQIMPAELLEENQDTGTLVITTNLPEEVALHITGPKNFRAGYIEDETLEELEPGLYSVAATAEDHDVVQGLVEVTAGLSVEVFLELEPLD